MTAFKYPLASSSWDQAEYDAIQRVVDSGMFTMGAEVLQFERQFAEFFGSQHCVMVNSGSSANLLMVAALFFVQQNKLQAGDEVIVPAVSWSTTYFPLQQYGLKLRFVDIDINTLNFDLDALADAVTDQTRLIMSVNLLGNPNDFSIINKIIAGRNIRLIEDNCESMGARFGGQYTGTFGVMGSFSSFFSHHISTMEGGLIVTDDEELYHILLSIRTHGWTRNLPKHNLVCGTKSDNYFEEAFRFVLPGYNVRPLEMSGAIGSEQLAKLPQLIAMRRQNAAVFVDELSDFSEVLIQREIGESSWFGFSLVIAEGASTAREKLLSCLEAEGVECRPIVTGNFTKNEVMRYFDAEIHGKLTNADRADQFGLFIGNHHYDISKAINSVKVAVAKAGLK